jgi:hypothetical protein
MEQKTGFDVAIYEGQRAWYERVLATFFFGVSVCLCLSLLYFTFIAPSYRGFILSLYETVGIGLYSFGMGLRFATTKDMLIDVDTNKIMTRYAVGVFSHEVISKVNKFEYISFYKDKDDTFNTNLWCEGNRHYKMYSFETKESAYNFSLNLSNKLKIDLLDATEKGNRIWIEKPEV